MSTDHAVQAGKTLFEFSLALREELSGAPSTDPGPGQYIGSGDGTARGEALKGTVRFDLYEDQGPNVCNGGFAGAIETNDGATIRFRTLGFFQLSDPESARWAVTASVLFETDDPRYAWLTEAPAHWEGVSDLTTYRHAGRVTSSGSRP